MDITNSPAVTSDLKLLLVRFAGNRMIEDGFPLTEPKRNRSQVKNLLDGVQGLVMRCRIIRPLFMSGKIKSERE